MDATERGCKQGLEYARSHSIEKMTFAAYCEIGKQTADSVYVIERARFAFLYGWRQAGEGNRTIFQLEDTDVRSGERRIQSIRHSIKADSARIEALLAWRQDDQRVHGALVLAYAALDAAQHELDRALKSL